LTALRSATRFGARTAPRLPFDEAKAAPAPCGVCGAATAVLVRTIDGIGYHKCPDCGCLLAEPAFLARVDAGSVGNYHDDYWQCEMSAARERCYGSTLLRVAEVFYYARRPIGRFIDIGAGSGLLLDALETLLPGLRDRFHGIELFPPPPEHRSRHPNYHLGTLGDLDGPFDAGVCIEVIEHLTPATLRTLAAQLAARSAPGALYYFNSGQPGFVEQENPGYLDPLKTGHIASYSIAGLRHVFAPHGFNVIALPGRTWAFLLEYGPPAAVGCEDLFQRLWNPLPENMQALSGEPFGAMFRAMGLEGARCYLEHATAQERTRWALSMLPEAEPTE
jgi:hypothetical protein